MTTTTERGGVFRFAGVAPGLYRLVARGEQGPRGGGIAVVRPGQPVDVRIQLGRSMLGDGPTPAGGSSPSDPGAPRPAPPVAGSRARSADPPDAGSTHGASGVPGVPGSIAGQVQDGRGAPVGHATVAVEQSPGRFPDIAAVTGADGLFRFSRAAPGAYRLAARAGAGLQGRAEVVVEPGRRAFVVIAVS
jgi:protocatechuate 3,4-dioxygenase beta subunit